MVAATSFPSVDLGRVSCKQCPSSADLACLFSAGDRLQGNRIQGQECFAIKSSPSNSSALKCPSSTGTLDMAIISCLLSTPKTFNKAIIPSTLSISSYSTPQTFPHTLFERSGITKGSLDAVQIAVIFVIVPIWLVQDRVGCYLA